MTIAALRIINIYVSFIQNTYSSAPLLGNIWQCNNKSHLSICRPDRKQKYRKILYRVKVNGGQNFHRLISPPRCGAYGAVSDFRILTIFFFFRVDVILIQWQSFPVDQSWK